MTDAFKWYDNTIDSIWGKILRKSTNSLGPPADKIRIQKLIFNRIPTKKRENQYYDFKSNKRKQCN